MSTDTKLRCPGRDLGCMLTASLAGLAAAGIWLLLYTEAVHASAADAFRHLALLALGPVTGASGELWLGVAGYAGYLVACVFVFGLIAWKPLLRLAGRGGVAFAGVGMSMLGYSVVLYWHGDAFGDLAPQAIVMAQVLFGMATGLVLADPVATRHVPLSAHKAANDLLRGN
ncbi:MAG: hypothetical protein PVJ40_04535 [Gammaproteobacteria bacterium]|jgi:hypothetical protein